MTDNRVIVSGAGPVGAVMTLALVKQGIPVTLIEQAGRRRGSARRHHPSADRGHAGQARPRKGDVLHRADRRHGSAAVPFPRPRQRRTDRGVRHPHAQGRGAVSVRGAMGAVQARARRAADIKASGLAEVRFSTKLTGLDADTPITSTSRSPMRPAKPKRCAANTDRQRRRLAAQCASLADIDFEGFTWPERFIKIGTSFDFGITGQGYCTRNYFSDPDEWLNLFKVKGKGPPGIWRGIIPGAGTGDRRGGTEHGRHPAPPARHP